MPRQADAAGTCGSLVSRSAMARIAGGTVKERPRPSCAGVDASPGGKPLPGLPPGQARVQFGNQFTLELGTATRSIAKRPGSPLAQSCVSISAPAPASTRRTDAGKDMDS